MHSDPPSEQAGGGGGEPATLSGMVERVLFEGDPALDLPSHLLDLVGIEVMGTVGSDPAEVHRTADAR